MDMQYHKANFVILSDSELCRRRKTKLFWAIGRPLKNDKITNIG